MPVYPRKSFLHITIFLSFLPLFLSCSSSPFLSKSEIIQKKLNIALLTEGNGPRLSEAVLANLSNGNIDEKRKKLLKVISGKTSVQAFKDCLKKFDQAPECEFLKPEWNHEFFMAEWSEEEEADSNSETSEDKDLERDAILAKMESLKKGKPHKSKKRNIRAVYENLKKGIITPAPKQLEGDYYHALKKFNQWTPELEAVAEKLKSSEVCSSYEIYHYLGLKAEEYMPDDHMFQTAMSMYRLSSECFHKDTKTLPNRYIVNAQFRLGLFLVMDNKCIDAQKVFSTLAKMAPNDYSTRAHYWSAKCSKDIANQKEYFSSYSQLIKVNPIGFHTLSISNGNSALSENLSQPIDPRLKTRTSGDSKYNVWIAAIEDLDKIGDYRGVLKLLSPARLWPEYLNALEPSTALYLATFSYRVKDSVSLFRILDSVFRNQSDYVVDSTLKLFYPLKYLDVISEKVTRVNPFLITALIRQESAFQEQVRSRVGAVGLMQLMPRTAKLMDRSVNRKKLLNPEVNIRVGIQYFEMLVDRFEGDVELALAAYNAGPEAVDRWKRRYQVSNRLLFLDLIPYSETRNYVTLIGRNYYWYSKLYAQTASTGFASEFRSLHNNEK